MARTRVLVALGANLPRIRSDPATTLRTALRRFPGVGIRVQRASPRYRNPADPPGSGPEFVNSVIVAETALSPAMTLVALGRIERSFGRLQTARSGARPLDLDLISYGNRCCPEPNRWRFRSRFELRSKSARTGLTLPHPGAHHRPFVLRPLLDVAPRWSHPALGRRAAALNASLPATARSGMRRLS